MESIKTQSDNTSGVNQFFPQTQDRTTPVFHIATRIMETWLKFNPQLATFVTDKKLEIGTEVLKVASENLRYVQDTDVNKNRKTA